MSKPASLIHPLYADKVIAGVDEAGRGCLAGPVVAAAVILPASCSIAGLNDSKLLSAGQREECRAEICEKAIAWAVAIATVEEIDRLNILQATFLAMHRAIEGLVQQPDLLLIDGNRFKPLYQMPFECIVKGDSKVLAIAAASVLAKTYRDGLMEDLHQALPQYGWSENKGYPTPAHRRAIVAFGSTVHHRQTFTLLKE